jgi:hypothetical protein
MQDAKAIAVFFLKDEKDIIGMSVLENVAFVSNKFV